MDFVAWILLISVLLNGVFLFAHYWLLNRALVQQHTQIKQEVADLFAGEPSPFAQIAGQFIVQLSQQVVMQIKTSLMGSESVSSKQAAKVADAVLADTNPVFSALSSIYPSLGKVLRKNPGALAQLSQLKLPNVGDNHNNVLPFNPNKFS